MEQVWGGFILGTHHSTRLRTYRRGKHDTLPTQPREQPFLVRCTYHTFTLVTCPGHGPGRHGRCRRTIGFPFSRLLSAPRKQLVETPSSLIQYTHARSPPPVCKSITPQHKQAAFVGRRLQRRGCPRAAPTSVPLADNRQPRSLHHDRPL